VWREAWHGPSQDREATSPAGSRALVEEDHDMSGRDPATAQYLCKGDPALKDYSPKWLKDVADDATLEGSMLDGAVIGPAGLRSVVLKIKSMYGRQEFLSVGPYGDNGWIEDYAAEVDGVPIGCVVLVKFNEAGQTQHVYASYRPRTSIVHFAHLLAEEFAGTPTEMYFRSQEP
jgi:hypothetical protein